MTVTNVEKKKNRQTHIVHDDRDEKTTMATTIATTAAYIYLHSTE